MLKTLFSYADLLAKKCRVENPSMFSEDDTRRKSHKDRNNKVHNDHKAEIQRLTDEFRPNREYAR